MPGAISVAISLSLGVLLGMLAGYLRGLTETFIMRILHRIYMPVLALSLAHRRIVLAGAAAEGCVCAEGALGTGVASCDQPTGTSVKLMKRAQAR